MTGGVWMQREVLAALGHGPAAVMLAQLRYLATTSDVIVRADSEWSDIAMTTSQAYRARRRLEEGGWITVEVRKRDGAPVPHIRMVDGLRDSVESSTPIRSTAPLRDSVESPVGLRDSVESSSIQQIQRDYVASRPADAALVVLEGGLTADARRLAELLADSIAERGSKRPTVTDTWIKDTERLMRIDGHDPAAVERTIRWLARGADEVASFWQPNVRCPRTLRERWDQMQEQYRRRTRRTGGVDVDELQAAIQRAEARG